MQFLSDIKIFLVNSIDYLLTKIHNTIIHCCDLFIMERIFKFYEINFVVIKTL